jgi:hypothetical protein
MKLFAGDHLIVKYIQRENNSRAQESLGNSKRSRTKTPCTGTTIRQGQVYNESTEVASKLKSAGESRRFLIAGAEFTKYETSRVKRNADIAHE